ncbi:MAG: Mov34/MPN/PAD-1 family protein [Pseudomonadota bacterium]
MLSVSNLDIGLTVSFTNECIDILKNNRRYNDETESGGLLFAKPLVGEKIAISKISLPNKKDKSGKYFFIPDTTASQSEINRQFEMNLAYIGDWHTHPTSSPRPSPKDISTIKKIFRESTHCLNYTLMIIIGTSNEFSDNYFCLTDGKVIYELSPQNN